MFKKYRAKNCQFMVSQITYDILNYKHDQDKTFQIVRNKKKTMENNRIEG